MDSEYAVKRVECELYSPSTWTISIGLNKLTSVAGYECKIKETAPRSNSYDIQYKVKEDEFSTLSSAFVSFPDKDGYSDIKTSTNVGIILTFNEVINMAKDKAKEILEYFILAIFGKELYRRISNKQIKIELFVSDEDKLTKR